MPRSLFEWLGYFFFIVLWPFCLILLILSLLLRIFITASVLSLPVGLLDKIYVSEKVFVFDHRIVFDAVCYGRPVSDSDREIMKVEIFEGQIDVISGGSYSQITSLRSNRSLKMNCLFHELKSRNLLLCIIPVKDLLHRIMKSILKCVWLWLKLDLLSLQWSIVWFRTSI